MKDFPPAFDYDPVKALVNWWKHGEHLAFATALWLDPRRVYLKGKNHHGETRFRVVAQHAGKTWACVFTLREGAYRLISVRRARKNEIAAYRLGAVRSRQ